MSAILTTLKAGKALLAADRSLRKGALQDQFDENARQLNAEVGQVAHAVCKAIVALALGKTPTDEDVEAFMAGAANDPAFPARAYRLLGEARKTATYQRRVLLAAILYGCASLAEDDRDRVDMLVERLTVPDVRLLKAIHDFECAIPHNILAWRNGIYAVRIDAELRVVPGHMVPGDGFDQEIRSLPNLPRDRVALVQLQALGLIELDSGNTHGPVPVSMTISTVHGISTTPLAHVLLAALRDVSVIDETGGR